VDALSSFDQTNEALILASLVDNAGEFTSGEALSEKLGLSRTAVWKQVRALRAQGYEIEAVPARGYRLMAVPDRLSALELLPLLNTRKLGRVLHHFEVTGSTNEVAFRLAQEGAVHGAVVLAEQQTRGKGRRGRVWLSPAGLNLYLSAILRPELSPQRAPELTLLAAVALAETLREAGAQAFIKWPNDVQVEGLKIAGILTELSAEPERVHFVVLGMGVNLNLRQAEFPPELKGLATSLWEARGARVPRALFTAALLSRLEAWLQIHEDEGFNPVREAWKQLSSTLGHDVVVRTERTEFQGRAEDVDAVGALLVRTFDGRLERVLAADVERLRPQTR